MPDRKWRDGERLYVGNDFVTMVYVATEDASKHGLGLHGEDQMYVIYISPAAAAPWAEVTSGACRNCGDPANQEFCGMCREMGCVSVTNGVRALEDKS